MNKAILFITVGHAGVGKSHFSRLLSKELGHIRISSDAARISLFGSVKEAKDFSDQVLLNKLTFRALDYAAQSILQSGASVIYDAANSSTEIRSKLYKLAKDSRADAVTIWITAPYDTAVMRTLTREDTVDQRKIPNMEAAKCLINKHISNIEVPTDEERVIKIDGTLEASDQISSFMKQFNKS